MENYILNESIQIATDAHRGQLCKNGDPYITHPLYIMSKFNDISLMCIAVLHDTIEDTFIDSDYLKICDIPQRIIDGVIALTHIKGMSYSDYIIQVSQNKDAIKVKLEDLRHNMDLTRLEEITEYDLKRTKKYHESFKFLEKL
jgi:(p)ppGpp synthase/HD superfamily hydrolase